MARPGLGRVLVVDDEEDIRNMLGIVLSVEGWQVEEASGGGEALARCTDSDFDVAVLDLRMPGLSGLDVARSLVEHGFAGSLVLFTAYADREVESECRSLGIPVVDKVDWYGLVEACRSAVRGKASLKAAPAT
jgi:CheY-like chemotaxis protein